MHVDQHGASSISLNATHLEELVSCFSDLVEHTRAVVFPPLRKGVVAPPDKTGWSSFRRLAFKISSPLPTTFAWETLDDSLLILLFWAVVSICWYLSADILLDHIFESLPAASDLSQQPIFARIVAYAIFIGAIGFIPIAYWRWIEFFRDSRYPVTWRIILAVCFSVVAISFPYWGLKPEYRLQFPGHLLRDRAALIRFVVLYVFLLIPFGTLWYMLATDMIVFGFWLLRVALKYLRSAHTPVSLEAIEQLIKKPIPSGEGGRKEWRLTQLENDELDTLRKWAVANREGTDKRLLPTALLFAFLGILADATASSDSVSRVLDWMRSSMFPTPNHTPPPLVAGRLMAASLILGVILIFLYMLLLLCRNLVIQSTIIEACILAEHLRKQRQTDPELGRRRRLWTRLLSSLWRR